MSGPGADPSRLRLERDLASADVENGVSAGLWRLVSLQWPYLTVAITTGDGHELGMRILLDNYPTWAPGGQPWDLVQDVPLPVSRWPAGPTASLVFRKDWSVRNGNAPYMACDRAGLAAHPKWASEHPARAWHARRTVAFYLREIHHELRAASLPQDPAGSTL